MSVRRPLELPREGVGGPRVGFLCSRTGSLVHTQLSQCGRPLCVPKTSLETTPSRQSLSAEPHLCPEKYESSVRLFDGPVFVSGGERLLPGIETGVGSRVLCVGPQCFSVEDPRPPRVDLRRPHLDRPRVQRRLAQTRRTGTTNLPPQPHKQGGDGTVAYNPDPGVSSRADTRVRRIKSRSLPLHPLSATPGGGVGSKTILVPEVRTRTPTSPYSPAPETSNSHKSAPRFPVTHSPTGGEHDRRGNYLDLTGARCLT